MYYFESFLWFKPKITRKCYQIWTNTGQCMNKKKSDFSWRQLNGIYWVGQKPGSQHCWKVCIVEPRMMCNVQCAMCSLEWCALCSPEWRTLTMEICVHCECGVWLWCGVENNEQHKPPRLLHRCALNYDIQTQSVMKHSAGRLNLRRYRGIQQILEIYR